MSDREGARTIHLERRPARSRRIASGTLACPLCDAPVALGPHPRTPTDGLVCPYCLHSAAARDFLSLGEPTRPQRVAVRIRVQTPDLSG